MDDGHDVVLSAHSPSVASKIGPAPEPKLKNSSPYTVNFLIIS